MNEKYLIIGANSDLAIAFINKLQAVSMPFIVTTSRSPKLDQDNCFKMDLQNDSDCNTFLSGVKEIIFDKIFIFAGAQGDEYNQNFQNFNRHSVNKIIDVNFTSIAFLISNLASKNSKSDTKFYIMSSRAGSIGERGSLAHHRRGGNLAYRISKTAVNAFIKNIAFDYQSGPYFYALHPGWVKTKSTTTDATYTPEEFAEALIKFVSENSYPSGSFVDLFNGLLPY